MAIFDKTDTWGLKYPLEVRVQHETCSTICRTPITAILNPKNLTGSAGGVKKQPKVAILGIQLTDRQCQLLSCPEQLKTLLGKVLGRPPTVKQGGQKLDPGNQDARHFLKK